MIELQDLLMGRRKETELTTEQKENLHVLIKRINEFFTALNITPKINDGLRVVQGSGSPRSLHFKGAAVDIDDDIDGTVWSKVFQNRQLLKEVGLWMEHPGWTHHSKGTWLHFQIFPPVSGKRFYIPNVNSNPNPDFWNGKYESSLDGKEQPSLLA